MSYYVLCICIRDFFSLNYCFAAVVLIATIKVEYIAVSCGIQADPSCVSRNVIYLALLAWENSSTAIG